MATRTTIRATVSVSPRCKESKAGAIYCNMGVADEKGRPVACVAFGQIASQLDGLEVGYRINLWGRERDGVFAIDGFEVPKVKRAETAKNWRVVEPPKMVVDELMDVLGPAYVERRIRERHGGSVAHMVAKFDLKAFKELMDELKFEASIAKEAAGGEALNTTDKEAV